MRGFRRTWSARLRTSTRSSCRSGRGLCRSSRGGSEVRSRPRRRARPRVGSCRSRSSARSRPRCARRCLRCRRAHPSPKRLAPHRARREAASGRRGGPGRRASWRQSEDGRGQDKASRLPPDRHARRPARRVARHGQQPVGQARVGGPDRRLCGQAAAGRPTRPDPGLDGDRCRRHSHARGRCASSRRAGDRRAARHQRPLGPAGRTARLVDGRAVAGAGAHPAAAGHPRHGDQQPPGDVSPRRGRARQRRRRDGARRRATRGA